MQCEAADETFLLSPKHGDGTNDHSTVTRFMALSVARTVVKIQISLYPRVQSLKLVEVVEPRDPCKVKPAGALFMARADAGNQ